MAAFAYVNRAITFVACAWMTLCVLGCSARSSPVQPQPPGPTTRQAAPTQSLPTPTALPQQVPQSQAPKASSGQPPTQGVESQQVPQAAPPQAQPAPTQQPLAQLTPPPSTQVRPTQPQQSARPQAGPEQSERLQAPQGPLPQAPQPQAPPPPPPAQPAKAPPQLPPSPAINPVGIWEAQIMTGYGVMYAQMILQPNGSYSYQVRWGDLMTWETGLYEVGEGFIHFAVQNYEPKVYKGTAMSRPTSWTVFYTVVDQDTMIWEDRVLGTQWTVYRRR